MAVETACLYSSVKNVSGKTMQFPFIPPHGKELDDEEQVSVPGDIRQTILSRTPGRNCKRRFDAFVRALGNNDTNTAYLQLISTPAPVVWDETDEVPMILSGDNGAPLLLSPCWETSV